MYSLELAKRLTALSRGAYKTYFNDVFKGEDRIYFPLNADNFVTSSFSDIKDCLVRNGYKIVDYIGGYATKDGKQNLKIGKILNFLNEQDLLEAFKQDSTRVGDNLSVVISRHPYDIGGMSTGRSWSSCMRLSKDGSDDGSYSNYAKTDIMSGTLVAYLISNTDRNIQKPLSRCLIKPYFNNRGNRYMNVCRKIYGLSNNQFIPTLNKIVNQFFNKNCPEDIYKFDNCHYNDGDSGTIDNRSEKTKRSIMKKLRSKYEESKQVYVDTVKAEFALLVNPPTSINCFTTIESWAKFNSESMVGPFKYAYKEALIHGGKYIYTWLKETFNPSCYEIFAWAVASGLNYDAWSEMLLDSNDKNFQMLSDIEFYNRNSVEYNYVNDELIDKFIGLYDDWDGNSSPITASKQFSLIFLNTRDRIDRVEDFIIQIAEKNKHEGSKLAYSYLSYYNSRHELDRITPKHNKLHELCMAW